MNFRASVKLAIMSGILVSTSALAAPEPEHPQKIWVTNNTQFNSTVKLLRTNVCGRNKVYTKPGETRDINWGQVNLLCNKTFPCTAEIYVGNNNDCGEKTDANGHDELAGSVALEADGMVRIIYQAPNHNLLGAQGYLTLNQ